MTPTMETKQPAENAPENLRNVLKFAIMNLTDKQAEYVLSRLYDLKKGQKNE